MNYSNQEGSLKKMIDAVSPFTAIITDDRNRERVSEKLIRELTENSCVILYTFQGDIVISSDGEKIQY